MPSEMSAYLANVLLKGSGQDAPWQGGHQAPTQGQLVCGPSRSWRWRAAVAATRSNAAALTGSAGSTA